MESRSSIVRNSFWSLRFACSQRPELVRISATSKLRPNQTRQTQFHCSPSRRTPTPSSAAWPNPHKRALPSGMEHKALGKASSVDVVLPSSTWYAVWLKNTAEDVCTLLDGEVLPPALESLAPARVSCQRGCTDAQSLLRTPHRWSCPTSTRTLKATTSMDSC